MNISQIVLGNLFFGAFIIGSCLGIVGCGSIAGSALPSDAELERTFLENRSDFELIVSMSNQDSSVTAIRHEFTDVQGVGVSTDTGTLGISQERWEKYKSLFRKLGIESGILRGADGSVYLTAVANGLGVSGVAKGYVYSTEGKLKGRFDCSDEPLDGPQPLLDRPFACKRLGRHWFLFISR